MSKKTMLFDATIIAQAYGASAAGRSGIYFTAYNLLKQFIASNQFDILVYSKGTCFAGLKKFAQDELPQNISIISDQKYGEKIFQIHQHCRLLRQQKKNIQRFFYGIYKNILQLFKNKIPMVDIAFSSAFVFPNNILAREKYAVLYDTIPLLVSEYSKDKLVGWFADLIKSLNNKDKYFAISQSAKDDFIKYFPQLCDEQITVTYLAASDNFYQVTDKQKIEKVCKKYNIPTDKKYIFSLCTLEPRKNLIRAVKTFISFIKKNKIDDLVFVLGGGHWEEFIGKIEQEISDLGEYKDKIIRAGYVADEDLSPLYSGAEWFVYTSQYEGFGLPPLEAMQCGCPVITSNCSSLPEVVGDAGIMIDYDSDEQHIKAYEEYYFDEDKRKNFSLKGLERAKQFSWQKCASLMIEVMENVDKTRN